MKILLKNKIKLPESFNHSDVIVEIPFKYGYINFYPYYNEAEAIIEFDKISRIERLFISEQKIFKEATEELNKINEKTIYNFIFGNSEFASQALKYEFEDLYFKLKKLTEERCLIFGALEVNDFTYCATITDNPRVKFFSRDFFFILDKDENGNLFANATKEFIGSVNYEVIQEYKQFIENNLDKLIDVY